MKKNNKGSRGAGIRLGKVNVLLALGILITLVIIFNVCVMISGNIAPDTIINVTDAAPESPRFAPTDAEDADSPEAPAKRNEVSADTSIIIGDGDEPAVQEKSLGEASSQRKGNEDKTLDEVFAAYDKDKSWTTNTKINIFDHGDKAVKSDGTGNADHVIAPGTSNTYTFTLANNKKLPITYTVSIEGANDSQYTIPVWVKITGPDGKSMTGDEKVMLKDFDTIYETNYLEGGESKLYTIFWEWPFERGEDSYDTSLGDTAVNEEIDCHMSIRVVAEYDLSNERSAPGDDGSDPNGGGGGGGQGGDGDGENDRPDQPGPGPWILTGDSALPVIIISAAALLSAGVVFILIFIGRRKKDKDENS